MVVEVETPITRCANCSRYWQYEEEDIHKGIQQIYPGEEYTVHYIVCPRCGNHLEVYPK